MTIHDVQHKPASITTSQQSTPEVLPSQDMTAAQILTLQHTIGNRATQHVLRKQTTQHSTPLPKTSVIHRMLERDIPSKDKPKYEEWKKKVETHNQTYPSQRVDIEQILGKAKTFSEFVPALIRALKAAVDRATQPQAAPLPVNTPLSNFTMHMPSKSQPQPSVPASKPPPTPTPAANPLASQFFSFAPYQPQTPQADPNQLPRRNMPIDILGIDRIRAHPLTARVAEFTEHSMTAQTISFNITVEETQATEIQVYRFVIHYHPAGTGQNPLHAKVNHADPPGSNVVVAQQNWLLTNPVSSPVFSASSTVWNNTYQNQTT